MKGLFLIFIMSLSFSTYCAEIYSKSFGNIENPAIIFLHGGPGYNSASFEATTSQKLSESGFFVIIYDRRGEGRSKDPKAKFNFKQSFKDLKTVYTKYDIQKSSLIGHSFGGILGTKFTKKYPDMVNSLILVGAPVSLQESFVTIIDSSKKIYTDKNDQSNLKYLKMLEEMDSESLEFAVYCFSHAMQNEFYSPDSMSNEAKEIYESFKLDSILAKYASEMTQAGTQGFWKNESYTSIDLSIDLKQLKEDGMQIYGLYGKEDGLYSLLQIQGLEKIIGSENVKYLENCSHSVFIDQQKIFVNSIIKWIIKN
jgi:proline iminopeptidase